jgi:hypothetical protein
MSGRVLLAIILVASSVTGCAPDVWVRPGASEKDAHAALNHCNLELRPGLSPSAKYARSAQTQPGAGSAGAPTGDQVKADRMSGCMAASGFSLQPAKSAAILQASSPVPIVLADPASGTPSTRSPASSSAKASGAPVRMVNAPGPFIPPQQATAQPGGAPPKAPDLIKACKAGDMTACILSDGGRGAPRTASTRLF